jgi:ribosomal protein S18 acetylase RimI-like enzyme
MLRKNMKKLPHYDFPDGFYAREIKSETDAAEWTKIWCDLEPPGKIGDKLFHDEFGNDWNIISSTCFLIIAPDGSAAGTISAWMNNNFKRGKWGRIHWVSLRKKYQGKGLAKPMLSMALNIISANYNRCYLVTQPHRIPAISLYLSFGFLPDMNSKKSRKLWSPILNKIKTLKKNRRKTGASTNK